MTCLPCGIERNFPGLVRKPAARTSPRSRFGVAPVLSGASFPHAGPNPDHIAHLESLVNLPLDLMQARLEVAVHTTEMLVSQQSSNSAEREGSIPQPPEAKPSSKFTSEDGDGPLLTEDALRSLVFGEDSDEVEDAEEDEQPAGDSTFEGTDSHTSVATDDGGADDDDKVPPWTTVGERVALAGGWNDLGSLWIARGEWEMAVECLRRALFWNPEQTASLLNLAGLLTRLGFENDAQVVMNFYDAIHGGTMGRFDRENGDGLIRKGIRAGLRQVARMPATKGRTLGELQLLGQLDQILEEEADRRRVSHRTIATVVGRGDLPPGHGMEAYQAQHKESLALAEVRAVWEHRLQQWEQNDNGGRDASVMHTVQSLVREWGVRLIGTLVTGAVVAWWIRNRTDRRARRLPRRRRK